MTNDSTFYESFVESLKVLGGSNVELVLHALEKEHVLSGGALDRERLEPALRSIFGDGAKVFLEIANNQKITR
jgi:hypothetical protein